MKYGLKVSLLLLLAISASNVGAKKIHKCVTLVHPTESLTTIENEIETEVAGDTEAPTEPAVVTEAPTEPEVVTEAPTKPAVPTAAPTVPEYHPEGPVTDPEDTSRSPTSGPISYPPESSQELHDEAELGPEDIDFLEGLIAEFRELKKRIKNSKYCTDKINNYLAIVNIVINETKQMIELIEKDMGHFGINHPRHRRDVVKKCRQSFKKLIARLLIDIKFLLDNDKIENTGAVKEFFDAVMVAINSAPDSNENKVYLDQLGKFVTSIISNDLENCGNGEPTNSLNDWNDNLKSLANNNIPLGNAFESFLAAVAEGKRIIINSECNQDPNTSPFIRLFKRHINYLALDLTEKYQAETIDQPKYNDELTTFNSTVLDVLHSNFGVLLDNVNANLAINGRKFDIVATENLHWFDNAAQFWRDYKLVTSADQIPAIPKVVLIQIIKQ